MHLWSPARAGAETVAGITCAGGVRVCAQSRGAALTRTRVRAETAAGITCAGGVRVCAQSRGAASKRTRVRAEAAGGLRARATYASAHSRAEQHRRVLALVRRRSPELRTRLRTAVRSSIDVGSCSCGGGCRNYVRVCVQPRGAASTRTRVRAETAAGITYASAHSRAEQHRRVLALVRRRLPELRARATYASAYSRAEQVCRQNRGGARENAGNHGGRDEYHRYRVSLVRDDLNVEKH